MLSSLSSEFYSSLEPLSSTETSNETSDTSFSDQLARRRALFEAGSSFPSFNNQDDDPENLFPGNMMDMELSGDVEELMGSIGKEGQRFEGDIRVEMKYRKQIGTMIEYTHQTMMGDLFEKPEDGPYGEDSSGGFGMDEMLAKEWRTTLWARRSEMRIQRVSDIKNRENLSESERAGRILDVLDETESPEGLNGLFAGSGSSHPMASTLRLSKMNQNDEDVGLSEFVRDGLSEKAGTPDDEKTKELDSLAVNARIASIKSRLFDLL
jgi:hypothetical protein